jgi:hypothetical protein
VAARPPQEFRLYGAEVLQVLNSVPFRELDLHLIMEELEDRLPEEGRQQLLQLIQKHLGCGHARLAAARGQGSHEAAGVNG